MKAALMAKKFDVAGRLVTVESTGSGNVNDTYTAIFRTTPLRYRDPAPVRDSDGSTYADRSRSVLSVRKTPVLSTEAGFSLTLRCQAARRAVVRTPTPLRSPPRRSAPPAKSQNPRRLRSRAIASRKQAAAAGHAVAACLPTAAAQVQRPSGIAREQEQPVESSSMQGIQRVSTR